MNTSNDVAGRPSDERLADKLLKGLDEHEPALRVLVDQWSSYWLKVRGESRDLQGQAISLFTHYQVEEAVANPLGQVAAGQAIAAALSLPVEGVLTVEVGDDDLAILTLTEGKQVCVVQKAEAGTDRWDNEQVTKQLLHGERIRPIKEAYRSLTETLAKIEDLVDHILLRGKPRGSCTLCPKDSRL